MNKISGIKIIIDKPQILPYELCKLVIEKASKDTKIIICGGRKHEQHT